MFQERREMQGKFMALVYEETKGIPKTEMVDPAEIGKRIGLSEEESYDLVGYLAGKNLVEWVTSAWIGITSYGVEEVELAMSVPDQPTENFAAFNLIQVEKMINSQIQQGAIESVQQVDFRSDEVELVQTLAEGIRAQLLPVLEDDDRREAEAQLDTVTSQLRARSPRRVIITEALRSLRGMAEGMLGGAALQALLHQFNLLGVT